MDKPPDNVKPLYRETLDPIAKERYRQKMELMGNIDPYEVSSGWLSDMDTLSDVTYPDIVNYLVNGVSYKTFDQMKAFKSLEAYNQFVCGWVSEIRHQSVQDKCLMIAKVSRQSIFMLQNYKFMIFVNYKFMTTIFFEREIFCWFINNITSQDHYNLMDSLILYIIQNY